MWSREKKLPSNKVPLLAQQTEKQNSILQKEQKEILQIKGKIKTLEEEISLHQNQIKDYDKQLRSNVDTLQTRKLGLDQQCTKLYQDISKNKGNANTLLLLEQERSQLEKCLSKEILEYDVARNSESSLAIKGHHQNKIDGLNNQIERLQFALEGKTEEKGMSSSYGSYHS